MISTDFPIDVIPDIATKLRSQTCAVYNAEVDVTSLSDAFRLEGDRRPDRASVDRRVINEFPTNYAQDNGNLRHMLNCTHCIDHLARNGLDLQKFISSAPKMGKKVKSSINGDYVRRFVAQSHGNDSAAWLACEIARVSKTTIPSWFVKLWLPMKVRSYNDKDEYYKCIAAAWKALMDVDAAHPGDESRYFVKICNEQKLGIFRLSNLASDLTGVSLSRRKDVVTKSVEGNLRDALETVDVCKFIPGTVKRAIEVSDATPWIPEQFLQLTIRFILMGDNEKKKLVKKLSSEEYRKKAAIDKAEKVKVELSRHFCETSSSEILFGFIDLTLRQRDIIRGFDELDMDVSFLYDDKIDDVTDNISGATSGDIYLIGEEVWDNDNRNSRWVHNMTPEEMRDAFDRRSELLEALQEKGLDLRDDSMLCKDYILYGTYDGPQFDHDYDNMESVVEMMVEMAYLFETRYSGISKKGLTYETIMNVIRYSGISCSSTRSDMAKLAFIYQHIKVLNLNVDDLPIRLREMANNKEEEIKEEWEYVDKWRNRRETERCYEYDSDSDLYYSDDSDEHY